jgi:hypothetical protein
MVPFLHLRSLGLAVVLSGVLPLLGEDASAQGRSQVAAGIRALSPESTWIELPPIRLRFDAHHPQGMVRVGDYFYLSAVEVTRRPQRSETPGAKFDRDPGIGVGHLFRFAPDGSLDSDLRLGEGTIYHPGGIDFDGHHIWVPVAEYRPRGSSIVYRVTPDPFVQSAVFRFADHIGAVAYDPVAKELHGVNWGSREFYRWKLPERGPVSDAEQPSGGLGRRNPAFYVDYQDCKWLGDGMMACCGLRTYGDDSSLGSGFPLGGIELVEARIPRPLHQVPVLRRSPSGRVLTQNAFWVEAVLGGLRFWFAPDDGRSVVRVFEVRTDREDPAVRGATGR